MYNSFLLLIVCTERSANTQSPFILLEQLGIMQEYCRCNNSTNEGCAKVKVNSTFGF